jgi:hypothetical protein
VDLLGGDVSVNGLDGVEVVLAVQGVADGGEVADIAGVGGPGLRGAGERSASTKWTGNNVCYDQIVAPKAFVETKVARGASATGKG